MWTPTLAGTRPGGAIASAWAVMHYLGVEGYREKARQVTDTRAKLMRAIDAMPELRTSAIPSSASSSTAPRASTPSRCGAA